MPSCQRQDERLCTADRGVMNVPRSLLNFTNNIALRLEISLFLSQLSCLQQQQLLFKLRHDRVVCKAHTRAVSMKMIFKSL